MPSDPAVPPVLRTDPSETMTDTVPPAPPPAPNPPRPSAMDALPPAPEVTFDDPPDPPPPPTLCAKIAAELAVPWLDKAPAVLVTDTLPPAPPLVPNPPRDSAMEDFDASALSELDPPLPPPPPIDWAKIAGALLPAEAVLIAPLLVTVTVPPAWPAPPKPPTLMLSAMPPSAPDWPPDWVPPEEEVP